MPRIWVALILACTVVVVSLGGYAGWTLREMPHPNDVAAIVQGVDVFDRNGQLLAQRSASGEFHIFETLNQMGRYGPAATLAAEDRSFYQHGPIDAPALARAGLTDLAHGRAVEGGSTITQQLVKIALLKPQKTISRKLQEAFLAWAMERRYTKDQILEMYLNRVYYGHAAYGLPSATKTYFGNDRDPKSLTLAQAAFLAGLLNAPNGLDPRVNYEGARARELYVLNGMVQMRVITRAEEEKAAQENIKAELKFDTAYRDNRAPQFVTHVLAEAEQKLGAATVQQGGIKVYTTLDSNLQARAEQAVASGVHTLSRDGVNNGALLAVRPSTGEILAWVGSADYNDATIGGQFDVVLSHRQPGSSFKPYVYEAALKDRKITLCTTLEDVPTDFNGYRPMDFDNRFLGAMSARRALVLSRNVPAVQVAQKEGIQNVIDLAHRMGIETKLDPTLPTAIGASEVSMYDQVQGYSVFADQGTKVPLMSITKIVDGSGNTLYQQSPGSQGGQERILSPAEAYLVTDTLKRYQYQWGLGWDRQFAAKSGTTGGAQSGAHPDAWMMAYSPDVVVGTWAGNTGPNGEGHPTSAFGVNVGSTITARFLNSLPSAYDHWYSRPGGIATGRSGEIFLDGTQGSACATRSQGGEGQSGSDEGRKKDGEGQGRGDGGQGGG